MQLILLILSIVGALLSVVGWVIDHAFKLQWLRRRFFSRADIALRELDVLQANPQLGIRRSEPAFAVLSSVWPNFPSSPTIQAIGRTVAYVEFGPEVKNQIGLTLFDDKLVRVEGHDWTISGAEDALVAPIKKSLRRIGITVFFIGITITVASAIVGFASTVVVPTTVAPAVTLNSTSATIPALGSPLPMGATPSPPTSHVPDDLALRPYVHFWRLVLEGTDVNPSTADLPIGPYPISDICSTNDRLELVFFMESPAKGSMVISQDKKNGLIVFNQEWAFSNETGKAWSNLMRPPMATFRENRLPLGALLPGAYILKVNVENKLSQNITFTVQ